MTPRPKLAYILNGFDRGGAELSLPGLVDGGLFAGFDLTVIALIRGQGDLESDLKSRGIKPVILVDKKRMSFKAMGSAAVRLLRTLLHLRPSIIVLSLPQANIIGRVVGSFFASKIISFEHNTALAKPIYETLFRLTSRTVAAIFVDSPQTGIDVKQKFYAAKTIPQFVIPLKHFGPPPPTPPQLARTRPRIVTVGRLSTQKNHSLLIDAISNLRRAGLDVEVDILGEGNLRSVLIAQAEREDVSDLVNFPGFVPKWWTRDRYDAFALTSLHEGLCIVALEAMWAGIPVIAPAVGGIQDYGTPDNMALLPARPTPAQIADAIRRIIMTPSYAQALSRNSQTTIDKEFSKDAAYRAYAKVNNAILKLAGQHSGDAQ